MSARSRRDGIVLVAVLFFVLLLASAIATFLRRVAMDAGVATHRDRALAAEALARGGLRLAQALLLEDLRLDAEGGLPDSLHDVWARVRDLDLAEAEDETLRLEIEDTSALVNLNAFVPRQGAATGEGPVGEEPAAGEDGEAPRRRARGTGGGLRGGRQAEDGAAETQRLALRELLGRVIADMPGRPEEKRWDPAELGDALIDWVDADEVRLAGGPEDEPYRARTPPVTPRNQPVLSVDELRLVEGFDGRLVEALRPYVTVFPLAGKPGVNLNTAPPWVLKQLTRGTDVSGMRPLEDDDVRRVLDAREKGWICSGESQGEGCVAVNELFDGEQVAPPPVERSRVFRVRAIATVVDVERRLEAVVDRRDPNELLLLSWRLD